MTTSLLLVFKMVFAIYLAIGIVLTLYTILFLPNVIKKAILEVLAKQLDAYVEKGMITKGISDIGLPVYLPTIYSDKKALETLQDFSYQSGRANIGFRWIMMYLVASIITWLIIPIVLVVYFPYFLVTIFASDKNKQ